MLISKYTPEITINSSNYQHFKKLGYDVEEGYVRNVPIEHVMKSSHIDVLVSCDKCGQEKLMMYKTYNKYKNGYFCRKCAEEKRKKTLMKNFKVEYPAQNFEIQEKMKQTTLKNYGYDNVSKVPEFKCVNENHNKKKKSQ